MWLLLLLVVVLNPNPMIKHMSGKRGGGTLQWSDENIAHFEAAKEGIRTLQKVYFVNPDAPIYVHCDACDYGVARYCYQIIEGKEQPIAFYSKSLSGAELRWTTNEQEMYAIVLTLRHFDYLIRYHPFILRTDHKNLLSMNMAKSQKVVRWKMELMELMFQIEHVP
jgi:RNase H-like domain found in reverse transcriptase